MTNNTNGQTMTQYIITNTLSGHCLGTYTADDKQSALDAMARDAGYADDAAASAVAPVAPGEIDVRESTLRLAYIRSNGYDSVLLLDDGKIVSEWMVDPDIAADFADPGDLLHWDVQEPNGIEFDGVPATIEDYGEELHDAELAARLAFYKVQS
jgi:hypothetical protein